jgi:hypothetical protein
MNMIVCFKEILDPQIPAKFFKVDAETQRAIKPSDIKLVISDYDESAMEAALKIKDAVASKITVISLGSESATNVIRHCIAMGADEGIWLSDPLFIDNDSYATAFVLAEAIKKIGDYDLILCGRQEGDWDANSGKTPEELLHRLEALPTIAERELAQTCKDVSNAGILGTISIMIENSGEGAIIELDSIPKPAEIELSDWLVCFQSFGFVLSVSPKHSETVIDLFQEREITAAIIGKVVDEPIVTLKNGPESKALFDFKKDKITGIVYNRRK